MRNTYSYLSDFLTPEELQAGLNLSLTLASEGLKKLTIFVNSISSCEQFLSEIFKSPELNKLRNNQSITINGISIELESTRTFDTYKTYDAILAIHTSASLLEKIDNNKSVRVLVLLAEDRDIPKEWLASVEAKPLSKTV